MHVVTYEAAGWGVGEIRWQYGRLVHLTLPTPAGAHDPQGVLETPSVTISAAGRWNGDAFVPNRRRDALAGLAEKLLAYFAGEPVSFDDVRLSLDGQTPFQRDVVAVLRELPRGETVTYGELAALAGRPNAQRAAASVCASNPFAVVVPCHRVVAATGIGGYGSLGPAYKRRLLALEGVDVPL